MNPLLNIGNLMKALLKRAGILHAIESGRPMRIHPRNRPWLTLIFTLFLAGCTLPSWVPFVNQVSTYTCESLPVGILIGGENDPYALEQRDGYELALQEINAAGGVNGCPLALIYQEETMTGNPGYTQTAVRSLVEDSQVLAVVGGTSETASMYAASLINYFEVPMLIPSAGGTHILPAENLWAFRLSASEAATAQTVFQMLKDELGANKKVAILFDDSTFGHDAAVTAVAEMEIQGLVVAAYMPYNTSDLAYADIMQELQMAMPDVLYIIFKQPQQAESILSALQENRVQPSMIIARGGGFATYAFLTTNEGGLNPLAENLVIATQWDVDLGDQRVQNFLQAFSDFSDEKYGQPHFPTQYNVEAYSSLVVLAGALQKTMDSPDVNMLDISSARLGLRQALQAYKTNLTPLGSIDLGTQGQNQSLVYLFQVIEGELVIVYPPDQAVHTPIFLSSH
jgi:branched-chain amino acid transport system substrate-binding protein